MAVTDFYRICSSCLTACLSNTVWGNAPVTIRLTSLRVMVLGHVASKANQLINRTNFGSAEDVRVTQLIFSSLVESISAANRAPILYALVLRRSGV